LAALSFRPAFAAAKISVRTAEKLETYTKVYVAPIGNDTRNVQPKLVARLKKAGFETVDLRTERLPFTSQGTGFILSPEGHVLTCAHVVGSETNATLWVGTNRYVGRVLVVDTNLDAALVLIDGSHPAFRPMILPAAWEQRMGQEVFTLGFPAADLLGTRPHLTKGMISSTVGLDDDERHVQISIPIQPGNSGSPLLDEHGRLIGMVDSTINTLRFLAVEGTVPQNVNFAIKSEPLRAFLAKANKALSGGMTNVVPSSSNRADDVFENAAKSPVLVRGGIVDEKRLKEHPLLCRCIYRQVFRGSFVSLRIDFLDVRKVALVLTANLDHYDYLSEDKVLDAMCEKIYDKFFPETINPFNPKKSRK